MFLDFVKVDEVTAKRHMGVIEDAFLQIVNKGVDEETANKIKSIQDTQRKFDHPLDSVEVG